ncbi:MAG: sugar transferase [Ktedonobacteraceae bacterium]|nr:sugar transferase [Ktedonobacteraceae bacterium]MBV9709332.1 sugar transferase [Ktedonobacteraceae bacterium]
MSVQAAPIQILRVDSSYQRSKRVVDIVFTLLIMIPLCIVTAVIALMIRLDSKGPIFFRQKRVGLNGVEFEMLKFRSMYQNNDDGRHREATRQFMNGSTLSHEEDSSKRYKLTNDSRVTRVGRFLRKTSIDELPQFFNVLRGEMTLVGPRPALQYEVDLYSPHDRLRLLGKPGLTGPWQVYGRSRVSFQKMVQMDIDYLHQQSLRQDLKLIALTVPVMLLGQGAA